MLGFVLPKFKETAFDDIAKVDAKKDKFSCLYKRLASILLYINEKFKKCSVDKESKFLKSRQFLSFKITNRGF